MDCHEEEVRGTLGRHPMANYLRPVYQPIFKLGGSSNGSVWAHEALVRMRAPYQTVSPLTLLDALRSDAEHQQLLEYVLLDAIRFLHANPRYPRVTVNIEPRLLQPQLPERVAFLLERYGMKPSRVLFEITERHEYLSSRSAVEVVNDLQVYTGTPVLIDDFYAGHNSLESLLAVEPSGIKLDGKLARWLINSPKAMTVLGTYVTMMGEFGMDCILEGVETPDILDIARDSGVCLAQGYALARPADQWSL